MAEEAQKQAAEPGTATKKRGPMTVSEATEDLSGLLSGQKPGSREEGGSHGPDDENKQDEGPVEEFEQQDLELDDEEFDDAEELEEDEEQPEGEADDEGDFEEDDDYYEVTVNGETFEVTFDELLSGYSRTADYTRKTQELAELREEAKQEKEQTATRRQEYGERLEVLEQALQEVMPNEPDWEKLKAENPQEYAARFAEWQQHQQRLQSVQQERQRVMQEHLERQQDQLQDTLEKERERLLEAVPEWNDEQTRKQEINDLKDYAISELGFSRNEVENFIDHRAVLAIKKAHAYDKLNSEGKKKLRRKKKSGKSLTPGQRKKERSKKSKEKREVQAARERLAETGEIRDAAELLKRNL